MDRVEETKKRYKEIFKKDYRVDQYNDSEFMNIMNRFIYGDVYSQGNMDDKIREFITIAVLTASQTLLMLKEHIEGSLNIGIKGEEIREVIYQCAPYIGLPKALEALNIAYEVFDERGISVLNEAKTTEETRFHKGLEVQKAIFGEVIDKAYENSPEDQLHIQKYLSSFCFGDFYTREIIDLKIRELLTLCIISSIGGCENQVKAHIVGNINVGNDKETLINAITLCIPYIGFPRALNAIAYINELIK